MHALAKAAQAASTAREKQEFAVASARRELASAERALAEVRAAEQKAAAALADAQSALAPIARKIRLSVGNCRPFARSSRVRRVARH